MSCFYVLRCHVVKKNSCRFIVAPWTYYALILLAVRFKKQTKASKVLTFSWSFLGKICRGGKKMRLWQSFKWTSSHSERSTAEACPKKKKKPKHSQSKFFRKRLGQAPHRWHWLGRERKRSGRAVARSAYVCKRVAPRSQRGSQRVRVCARRGAALPAHAHPQAVNGICLSRQTTGEWPLFPSCFASFSLCGDRSPPLSMLISHSPL